jgi:hypothetical protein
MRKNQLLTKEKEDETEEPHQIDIPVELQVKKDSTKDLQTIFSARVTVNFKKGETTETVSGRWCMICK